MNNTYILIGNRRPMDFGGWSQMVCVADRLYFVGLEPGKRVRIPFKPRGKGAYGHKWIGFVRSCDDGKRVYWYEEVPGSLGVRGLLQDAGVLAPALAKAGAL